MNKTLFFFLLSTSVMAQAPDYGYLKPEDQKFFQNDSMEGNGKLDRIDMNVKEINKLHSEMNALKGEVQKLKQEIEELKKKK